MFRTIGLAFLALTAGAQTQIDLRSQAKGVDFTAAASTKPMKTGTVLPATCGAGEMFFKTNAPAGANLYACAAANVWSGQGVQTIQSNGVTVGTQATTNFSTGPGLLSLTSDTGSAIDVLWALDTAVNQTQPGEQSGAALWCDSNSASGTAYACSMTPTAGAYTTGMTLHWRPDVTATGGPTTLNIDTLGATPVKLADGTSDPTPSDIVAGRLCDIWFDGVEFRLAPTTAAAVGAVSDTRVNGILYRSAPGVGSAATADQMSGPFFCQDTANTAGAYACNLTPAIGGYGSGTTYWFRANTTNGGAATVSFNSLGAKAIKKQSNVDLAPGDITAGQWVMLTYDGTNMQMLSQAASAAGGGPAVPVINTAYVKYEDDFTCGYYLGGPSPSAMCLLWNTTGTGQVNGAGVSVWPHLGVYTVGGSAASAGNSGGLYLTNIANYNTGMGSLNNLAANGPWEMDWIFHLNQTTNTRLLIGLEYAGGGYDDRGVGLRYNTTSAYGDTSFMFEGEYGNGGGAVSSGIAADTNWHHLRIFLVSANKMGMSLDGGSTVTLCASGCTITNNWNGGSWPFAASVYCGSGTVAAQTTVDLDYFGFVATVGSR
jgi:hypothetical protein